MERWQSSVDRQIQKAIEEGQMAKLPGEGKPLTLNDDPNTPDELRMAYKILRDNAMAPDWMMQSQELDRKRNEILETLQRAAQAYRKSPDQSYTGAAWRTAQKRFREAADAYNKQALTYNLKVPQGLTHKPLINVEREINRALM